ncbi:hypothetical protein BSZ07_11035 [Streptomyces sp. M1013]|nr:hypothetical protein BSZ07_11035 [Streptomyces sp. M1013]
MIAAYREPDRSLGKKATQAVIDALAGGVPAALVELRTPGGPPRGRRTSRRGARPGFRMRPRHRDQPAAAGDPCRRSWDCPAESRAARRRGPPRGRVIASVPRARSRWRHRANGEGRESQPASSDTSSTY